MSHPLGPTRQDNAAPKVLSIAQTTKPHKAAWQLVQTRLQQCGELDFPCLKQSFAGNTTAASSALCEQSCCLEEAPGKQQHPTQPACLPSRPNLNRDCWNISKRKFKNKTQAPGATCSSSSVSAGSRGQPPITLPPAPHPYAWCKLNVSGTSAAGGDPGFPGQREVLWDRPGAGEGRAHRTQGSGCGHPAASW